MSLEVTWDTSRKIPDPTLLVDIPCLFGPPHGHHLLFLTYCFRTVIRDSGSVLPVA